MEDGVSYTMFVAIAPPLTTHPKIQNPLITVTYSTTDYKYIQLDEAQVPMIVGTTMKVVELVMSKVAHGWSPEELHFQYPHINLGQIHSALAYYWDHQDALDADIKHRREKVEAM